MLNLEYSLFYRRFGVRRVEMLTKPMTFPITALELPKNALIHYVDESGLTLGPVMNEPYLVRNPKAKMIDHVTQLKIERGVARPVPKPINKMIRDYHLKNRMTRPLKSFESTDKDPLTLVIENYAVLPQLYKYVISPFSSYNAWWNLQATVWDRVNTLTTLTQRHQFFMVQMPQLLPSLALLRSTEKLTEPDRRILKTVSDHNAWFLIELWKWMGEHRENSVLSRLNDSALEHTNFIWQNAGRWFVVNLGLMNQWRTDYLERDQTLVQRRWLRGILELFSLKTVNQSDTKIEETAIDTDGQRYNEDEEDITPVDIPEAELEIPEFPEVAVSSGVDLIKPEEDEVAIVAPKPSDADTEEMDRIEALDADADFKELNELTAESDTAEIDYKAFDSVSSNPKDGVIKVAEKMAAQGLLNPIEFKTISQNASRFETLKDPFQSGKSIAEAMKITADDVKITDTNIVGEVKGVLDTSMLNSSLQKFDPEYIQKVLPKDILNSVIGIQNAGIAVTGYEVFPYEDMNDHYQIHTVRITPVVGKPSTLRFKLPVVTEEGTFRATSVQYRLRKQRRD